MDDFIQSITLGLPPHIFALFFTFNVFWFATYFLVIRRGFKDMAFGVPIIAVALNTAWDYYGSFGDGGFIQPSPAGQQIINIFYMVIELILYYQIIRFWQSDNQNMTKNQFYFFVFLSTVMAFMLYRAFVYELRDDGGVRMAYVDNFVNSAMFIAMFFRRPTLAGQSLYIGLFKMIGTASAIIGTLLAMSATTLQPWVGLKDSVLLPAVYIGIFVLDLIYVVLVYQRSKTLGLNPWKRF